MRGIALGVVGLLLIGCSSDRSHIPADVAREMGAVEAALLNEDADAVCGSLGELQDAIYEWQSISRGNFPVRLEQHLMTLDVVRSSCQVRSEERSLPFADVEHNFSNFSSQLRKDFTVKGGTPFFLYLAIGLVIFGFVIFWKRKFYEA